MAAASITRGNFEEIIYSKFSKLRQSAIALFLKKL